MTHLISHPAALSAELRTKQSWLTTERDEVAIATRYREKECFWVRMVNPGVWVRAGIGVREGAPGVVGRVRVPGPLLTSLANAILLRCLIFCNFAISSSALNKERP